MIPKIVHQLWYSDDQETEVVQLPNVLQKIYDENCKINQGYEFKLWNNSQEDKDLEKLIENDFPKIMEVYKKAKLSVQKADIKRIAILYYYGGIYIDVDVMFLRSLDDLLQFNSDVLLSLEPEEQSQSVFHKKNVICNAFMCTPAKHEIFKKALEVIETLYKDHGDNVFKYFNSFGADIITKALKETKTSSCKLVKNELVYPITDPKIDTLNRSQSDIRKLKNKEYGEAFMVHYWIHCNFESKKLINEFAWDANQTVNTNIYTFFKQLYPANKYLKE